VPGQLVGQLGQTALDLVRQGAVGERHAIVGRRRDSDAARRVGPRQRDARDLRQVVVLGLQPEHRDHRLAGALGQRGRDPDRRRRLVDGEQRAEEQADLLSGDHGGGPGPQRGDVRVAGRAGGERGVLGREHVRDRGRRAPRLGAGEARRSRHRRRHGSPRRVPVFGRYRQLAMAWSTRALNWAW
jgi:hypothetical protein